MSRWNKALKGIYFSAEKAMGTFSIGLDISDITSYHISYEGDCPYSR